MRRLAGAVLAAALLVAGCSSTSGSPDRSALVRSTLRQDVYTLTALAHRGAYVNARTWVAQLQQDVMYARSAGALSVAQENRIVSLLNTVAADLAAKIAASGAHPAAAPKRTTSAPSSTARSSSASTRPQSSQAALSAVTQTPPPVRTTTMTATAPAPASPSTTQRAVKKSASHRVASKHSVKKKHKHKHKRPG